MEISVVIPVFNEAENLLELVARLTGVLSRERTEFEIIFVDDGSTDSSRKIILDCVEKNPHLHAIFLGENEGQQEALLVGFEASAGMFCITLDADLQNPPEEIPKILKELRAGHDVVGSVRKIRCDTVYRRVCSRAANWSVGFILSGIFKMSDYGCMLRGYSRKSVNFLIKNSRGARFVYLPILVMAFAENPCEIKVLHLGRSRGRSKYIGFNLFFALFRMLVCAIRVKLRKK